MESIITLKVEPERKPIPVVLELSHESLRCAVSIGSEEVANVVAKQLKKDVCIVYADDGFLYELEANRKVNGDIICGVFYVTGINTEGYLTSLTGAQIREYTELFRVAESFDYSEVIYDWSKQFERWIFENANDG